MTMILANPPANDPINASDNPKKAEEQNRIASYVLARTIWAEARGDSVRCQEAIACTIMNRIKLARTQGKKWWGDNIIDICLGLWDSPYRNESNTSGDKFPPVINMNDDPTFKICLRIARRAIRNTLPDITKGATHYHCGDVIPKWAEKKHPCETIGFYSFYRNIAPSPERKP